MRIVFDFRVFLQSRPVLGEILTSRYLVLAMLDNAKAIGNIQCQIEEPVMFYDTDCGGVVHNLAYLRMVEKCRTILAADLGFDLAAMGESGIFPVIVRTEADYRKPGKLGDTLKISGWLEEWGKVKFWCGFTITRESETLISARQSLALVKMPEGRVKRLPKKSFQQS